MYLIPDSLVTPLPFLVHFTFPKEETLLSFPLSLNGTE
jgi:hypothetical protein